MQDFYLDRDLCTRCGQCIYACGRQALVSDSDGCPSLYPENSVLCNACGHCSAICPAEALVSPGSGGERAMPYPDAPEPDFASVQKFLLSCRSMRRYRQELVEQDQILEVLDIARKAPSASNLQPVSWVVLSGREKAQRFTVLTLEWFDKVLRHDAVFSARYNIDLMLKRHREGDDPILRGAPHAVFALTSPDAGYGQIDAAIATSYFCLAAHGRGIGSCWCGFGLRALEAYQPLREMMGFDDSVVVQGMAFFGYPEITYHAVPPRRPLRVRWF